MDGFHGGKRRQGHTEAFTLLELLVALAILGILAAMTIPRWGTLLPVFRLNSATRQIHSELHNLKAHAASENVSFQLIFSGDQPQYATRRGNESLATRELPRGITIAGTGRIAFSPRGTALGGRVRMRNDRGACSQVVVSPTGRIRMCRSAQCDIDC